MTDEAVPLIVRYATRVQEPIEYVQVTMENKRAVAEWCGGHSTDELVWSSLVEGYIVPDSDEDWYLASFVPGVVVHVIDGVALARVSDYVLRERSGLCRVVTAEEFVADYRDVIKPTPIEIPPIT